MTMGFVVHCSALLNLPKTATQEEIKEKYRALASEYNCILLIAHSSTQNIQTVILHPDKQATEEQRAVAQDRFRQVQGAYEGLRSVSVPELPSLNLSPRHSVLSDPNRRAVYDELGEDGLRSEWAVGQKFKSASEVWTPPRSPGRWRGADRTPDPRGD